MWQLSWGSVSICNSSEKNSLRVGGQCLIDLHCFVLYNDYKDYNDYSDYRDSDLDLDWNWERFMKLVTSETSGTTVATLTTMTTETAI